MTASIILLVLAGLIVASVVLDRQKPLTPEGEFSWRQPLFVALGTSVILLSMVVYSPYLDIIYLLLVGPIACFFCVGSLIAAAIRKDTRRCLSSLLTLVAFLLVSAAILMNEGAIRASFRWLALSRQFKSAVWAQPVPSNGELRHMVWEETGFAGVANNTVYLAFDPSDALSAAHLPGKVAGIPCPVFRALRLEHHWYSVWFYTDETWSECPRER